MPILSPEEALQQHLKRLIANEKVLSHELDRMAAGLAATREQIRREREALAGYAGKPHEESRAA